MKRFCMIIAAAAAVFVCQTLPDKDVSFLYKMEAKASSVGKTKPEVLNLTT